MSEQKLPKISIFTLGCKVNQYDADAMLAVFDKAGFEVCEGLESADIYVINTCAVTAEAEKKSRQAITRIKKVNPKAEIYVCGCASQNNFSQFAKDGVEYISGTDRKLLLTRDIVEKYCHGVNFEHIVDGERFEIGKEYEDNDGVLNLRTRHFIKVQDGCNNFCSYCIIPYLRGRSRSRKLDSIIAEIEKHKSQVKEIILTGINLSAYGRDINLSLAGLLRALSKFDLRVRLGSLEVGVVDREFLEATKGLKRFCPHFHLSLQSGDDEVLHAMNRHYTCEQYYQKVRLIREYYPDAAITTDIIVGFPSESDKNFENTIKFAKKVGFADIHVFPYSSRKGTVAGKMKVLSPEIVEKRKDMLCEVKAELVSNYLMKQIGMPAQVLFETQEDGYWCGHTLNYVKVYSKKGEHNTLRNVTPTKKFRDGLCD